MKKIYLVFYDLKTRHARLWAFVMVCCGLICSLSGYSQITVDGNTDDWNMLNANPLPTYVHVQDAYGNGVVDNQFTEGTKDIIPAEEWVWSVSQTKAKNDIANGAVFLKGDTLFFAGDRTSNNGDAQIGFWLFLDGTGPLPVDSKGKGAFFPQHNIAPGDLLVLADFTGGGKNGNVTVYQWVGAGNGDGTAPDDHFDLITTPAQVAENNGGPVAVPGGWSFINNDYETNTFYEGYIDLSFILGEEIVQLCGSSFMLETRSSQELTASLDDFVADDFISTPKCSITGLEVVCPGSVNEYSAPEDYASYSWSVSGGATITAGENEQTVSVEANSACGSYTLTLTVSSDGLICNSECELVVGVVDNEAPVLPELPAGGDLGCNPTPPVCIDNLIATDNCAGEIAVVCEAGEITGDCSKSQTFTYTATDACDNSSVGEVIYAWKEDLESPVITADMPGEDLGCNPTAEEIEAALGSASVSDNCDTGLSADSSDGAVSSDGCMMSQTRTFTAVDECLNEAVPVEVTVMWKVDTEAPVITAASQGGDIGCNPTAEEIEAALGGASVSDNCDTGLSADYSDGDVSSDGCMMSQTRTFTAIDECLNEAVPVEVTVMWKVDTEAPVITAASQGGDIGCNPTAEEIEAALGGASVS
ncbi:hypothetical protein, partial [Mangrovibacterium lignilyticum]|uniref:hypothetical protein n=1 Tax=Mangrovibacterium lignilyticum TaxID=2668052 RepID=UPI0013D22F80